MATVQTNRSHDGRCPSAEWSFLANTCYSAARLTSNFTKGSNKGNSCTAADCQSVYAYCASQHAEVTTKDELKTWIRRAQRLPQCLG